MCAIFGGRRTGKDTLVAMARSMTHRGPDGSGFKVTEEWGLGMNRLAIMDLPGGVQPLSEGKVTAVCNGEIYNWRELRGELEEAGFTFRTSCDCEILPAAWLAWGTEMFGRLNGMFAIAILDGERLILARDRCGQKPLYYYSDSNSFLFSSEIRGLEAAGMRKEADPLQLPDYLLHRYVPEPKTFWRGISTLAAGHFYDSDSGEVRAWWRPAFTQTDLCYEDAVSKLGRLTEGAVRRTLQADVPLCAYLSGGVDSALLVTLAAEVGVTLPTLTASFGAKSDEDREAAATAKSLGLEHQSLTLDEGVLENLPRTIQQMERPVGDLLVLAFDSLADAAAKRGYKVALGGEGVDELFAGYSFQKVNRMMESLPRALRGLPAAALHCLPAGLVQSLSEFPASLGRSGLRKVEDYFRGYRSSSEWWRGIGLRTLFTPPELQELLVPDLTFSEPELPIYRGATGPFERLLGHQFDGWLQDWALIRQDKNAMAHSVEYRAPFLDTALMDFAFSLPTAWKVKGLRDKIIWRDSARKRLAAGTGKRRKQPFYFPLENELWRRPFDQLVDQALAPDALPATGWFREGALRQLKARAVSGEFLILKQLAALVILHLHISG